MAINVITIREIDKYIRTASGGSHKEFATKLGISQATLSRHIRYMKNNGAPIEYDYLFHRHYYKGGGYFLVDLRFIAPKHAAEHKNRASMLKN